MPEFKPITDFEFTEADKAELFASEERTLKPTILPADRTYSTITWKSSDTSIATVTKDGVVRGVDGGEEEELLPLLLFLWIEEGMRNLLN